MLSVRSSQAVRQSVLSLQRNQSALEKSLERISSGLRINRAADDPAGLSIATRMQSDAQSMSQAMRNANNSISLVQTAEGGLSEIYNALVRMRELSVQAANETYNSTDRSQMNVEFKSLAAEVNRIASNSNYNRRNLLNGSDSLQFQIGIHNTDSDRISLSLTKMAATMGALNMATLSTSGITTISNAQLMLDGVDNALTKINVRRSYLGAIQNRLESAVSNLGNQQENLVAASSQIMDLDYAEESANMVRLQIRQQASLAALSQARSITQSIVSLLS